jgi:hypothetical protein
VPTILHELHNGIGGRHFSSNTNVKKIFYVGYWWPTMRWNFMNNVKPMICAKEQVTYWHITWPNWLLLLKPFQKWELNFIGPIKSTSCCFGNQYILIVISYVIKWVDVRALHTNITNQATHFINNVIRYLIDHFILKHMKFTIYYPQGNGQGSKHGWDTQKDCLILHSLYPFI